MTSGQSQVSGRAEHLQVRQHGQSGHLAQRTSASPGRSGRRVLLHPLDVHRRDQPRSGGDLLPDRLADRGSAEHRFLALATAWAARTATCPPTTVLTSVGAGRYDQPLYDRLWGSGFLPTHHQGVKLRNSGDAGAVSFRPGRGRPRTRRDMLDDLAKLNQIEPRTSRRSGDQHAHLRNTSWRSACRPRCRN